MQQGRGIPILCAGAWTNNPFSYNYQWFRDGVPLIGQSDPSYTAVTLDQGSKLTCEVVAEGVSSNSTPVRSTASESRSGTRRAALQQRARTKSSIGPAQLGLTRTAVRKRFKGRSLAERQGRTYSVSTRRHASAIQPPACQAITANRAEKPSRDRRVDRHGKPDVRARRAARRHANRIGTGRPAQDPVGGKRQTWYFLPGHAAPIFGVAGGTVQHIALADERPQRTQDPESSRASCRPCPDRKRAIRSGRCDQERALMPPRNRRVWVLAGCGSSVNPAIQSRAM